MFQKLLKITGFLMLAAFLVVTVAFTSHESKNIVCRNIQVEFNKNDLIKLNEREITRMLLKADKQLIGKNLEQINTDVLETEVEKNQAILKAEVYKIIAKDKVDYAGILGVKIKHRRPVLRVMTPSGSYYLDKFGRRIPVSVNYSANVLVVTGNFSEEFAKDQLLPFVLYVQNDDFWRAQVRQIEVENSGNILLSPLVGNHLIELGNVGNYPVKLRNMKAFYKQVMVNNNWNKYSLVSVKYKNQVIAKKR